MHMHDLQMNTKGFVLFLPKWILILVLIVIIIAGYDTVKEIIFYLITFKLCVRKHPMLGHKADRVYILENSTRINICYIQKE